MFPNKKSKKTDQTENTQEENETSKEYEVLSNALGQDASEFNIRINDQINILNNFRKKINDIKSVKIVKENENKNSKTPQAKGKTVDISDLTATLQKEVAAASGAPDDDGDDAQKNANDFMLKTKDNLKTLQYNGEIDVEEVRQVEVYYEKIKDKKFKMNYDTGTLSEIQGSNKNQFQYLGVWSSMSGSILIGRAFLPMLGGGLKSFISKFIGQDGAIYEFSEKMAKGIPFSGSETIGGISGINAYINIYFFLNATTKALQNGNPDYLLRYLAQNSLQKVLSMVMFKGLPYLVGMTSMPVLLSSVVASALPFVSPLSALTQKIFTSDAAQMGVSMGSQWVGTMVIGEFMNYRFKELAEFEQMEKDVIKNQQSAKRKRESFKRMMRYMEEQKHDQITDRLIRGEYNLMDKIHEVANDNSGLIGFLLGAVGAVWGLREMGLFQSNFWNEQVVPSADTLSEKLEEMLDINTKTFPDQMKAFLIPLIQKQMIQQFEIREKIQKRVNEIIREKVIPYLKEFESIEKLSKWNMFKEIKVLRYILIEKMRIKSLEYYTVEKLFESMTTNNITQMVYGQVEDFATNGLQYIDEEGETRHLFGSLLNPATYFGASKEEKEGHWAEGSVSALRKVSTMIGNHWVSGFDDLNKLAQKLGSCKLSLGNFKSFLARWSGTETALTQESDADVLQQVVSHLWKDGIIPPDYNLGSIQTIDDLKTLLDGVDLTPDQGRKYIHLRPLGDLSIEKIKILFQSPQFLLPQFVSEMHSYADLRVHSNGRTRKLNLETLFFGIYPESLLRKYYTGDDLESKMQQGQAELQLLNAEYGETVKNVKSWAPKLKPFWENLSDFKRNAQIAAGKSKAAKSLRTAQDALQKATQQAEQAKLQSDKQIETEALAELVRAQELERIAQAEMDTYGERIYDGTEQMLPDDVKAHEMIWNMSKSILRFHLPKSFFQIKDFVSNGFYLDIILKSLKNMFLDFWKNPSSVKLNMSAQEYLSRMTQLCSRTNTDENKSCEVFAFEKLIQDTQVGIINAETWKTLSDQDKLAFFNAYFSFIQSGDFNFLLANFKDYLDPTLVNKMTVLQEQGISIFPTDADKPEDGLAFYDAFKRPIFKHASEMGDFACLGSVSEFIDNINDFFKNLTGSGFDAEFARNTMKLYGRVGHRSDPQFLSELGIPLTQGEKQGDVSYVLGSLQESPDFKGVDWETISGPDGEAKAALFVEYMKYHAFMNPEDMPFNLDKFSSLAPADKLKAVQLYFKLFKTDNLPEKNENESDEIKQQRIAQEKERNTILGQLMGGTGYEAFKDVFKKDILKFIVDRKPDYDKYYNFFTGAIFKTYKKNSGNAYTYTGFRKLVEKQRDEIKHIERRMLFFAANYCLDDRCRNEILNPPENVSLIDHIQALEKIFDGKLNAEQQRPGYIFMFATGDGKPPGIDLSKNTKDVILQIETHGRMNVEQQIAYFEKHVGKLVSYGKKRSDYLIELIDTFKVRRNEAIDKLKPFYCKLDNNCDKLYDQINFQFLKNIDVQQMSLTQTQNAAASFEQLNLVHSDLGTFFLNFRGSTVQDLATYENMIANFNGKTIEEFQAYLQQKTLNGTADEKNIATQIVGQLLQPISSPEMNQLMRERDALISNLQISAAERDKQTAVLNDKIAALESKSGLQGLIARMKRLITKRDALKAKPTLTEKERQKIATLMGEIDATLSEINTKFGSAIRGTNDAEFGQRIRTRFDYTSEGFIIVNTEEGTTAQEDPSIAEKLSQKEQDANIPLLLAEWDIDVADLPDNFYQLPFSQKMTHISSIINGKITFINNLPDFIIPCVLNKPCKPETFINNQKRLQYPITGSTYKHIMGQLQTLYSDFHLDGDAATPAHLETQMRTVFGKDIELLHLKNKFPIKSDEAIASLKNCGWVMTGNIHDELDVFKAYESMMISLKREYDEIPTKYPPSFAKDILSKPFYEYKPTDFKRAVAKLKDRIITYDDKCAFLTAKGVSIECSHRNEEEVLHQYEDTKQQMDKLTKGLHAAEKIIGSAETQTHQLTLQQLKELFEKKQHELDENDKKIIFLKYNLGIAELPQSMTQLEKLRFLQQRFDDTKKDVDILTQKMSSSSIYGKKIAQLDATLPLKDRKEQMQLLWNAMTTEAIMYGYKGDIKGLTGVVFDQTFKKYQDSFLDKLILLTENGYGAEVRTFLTGIDFNGDISQLKALKMGTNNILQHLSLNEIMNAESKLNLVISLKQLVSKDFKFISSGNLDTDLDQLKKYESLMTDRIKEWSLKWRVSASDYETKPLTEQYTFLQKIHEKNAAVIASINGIGFFKTKFEENAEGLAQIRSLFHDDRFTSADGSADQILQQNDFPNPAVQLLMERIQLFDAYSKQFPPKKSIAEYQELETQLVYKASKVSTLLTVQSGPAYGNVLIGDKYYKISDIEAVFAEQLQKLSAHIKTMNDSLSEKFRLQLDPSKVNDFDYLRTLSNTLDGIQKHQASIQAEIIRKINLLGLKGTSAQQNCQSSSDIENCLEDLLKKSTNEWRERMQKVKKFYQKDFDVDRILTILLRDSDPTHAAKIVKDFNDQWTAYEKEQSTLIEQIVDLGITLEIENMDTENLKELSKNELNAKISELTGTLHEKNEQIKKMISNIGVPDILTNANMQNQTINKQIAFLIAKEKELQALIKQKAQLFVGLPVYDTFKDTKLNLTKWLDFLNKEFDKQARDFKRLSNGKPLLPNLSIASQFEVISYQYSEKTVDLLKKLCGSQKSCFRVETMQLNGKELRFLLVDETVEKYLYSDASDGKQFTPLDVLIRNKLDRLKPFYQDYQKYVSFIRRYKPEGFGVNSAGKITFNGRVISNYDLLTGNFENDEWQMGKFQFLDDSIRKTIQSVREGLSQERQQHFNALAENKPAIDQLKVIEDILKTEHELANIAKDQIGRMGGAFMLRSTNFKASDFDITSRDYNPEMVSLFFKEYTQLLNTIASEYPNDKRIQNLVQSCSDFSLQLCINLPLLNSFLKNLDMSNYVAGLRFFKTLDYEFDDQFFMMPLADQTAIMYDMMKSIQQNKKPLFDVAASGQYGKFAQHIDGLAGAHIDTEFDSFVREILPSMKDHPLKTSLETAFKKIDDSTLSAASKRQSKYNLYINFQKLAFLQSTIADSDFNSILDTMVDSDISFGEQVDAAEKQVLTGSSDDEKQKGRDALNAIETARNEQADRLLSQQLDYLIGQFKFYLPDMTDFTDGVLSEKKDAQLNDFLKKVGMSDARISLDDPENGMRNRDMSVSEFIKYATLNGWSHDDIIKKLLPIAMDFPMKDFSPPDEENVKGAFSRQSHQFIHDEYKRALLKMKGGKDDISDSDAKTKSADEINKAGLNASDLDNFLIMSKSITQEGWNDADIQRIASDVRSCLNSGQTDCLQKQYLLGDQFMSFSEIYLKGYELLITQFGNTKDDLKRLRADIAEAIETSSVHLSKASDQITAQLQIAAMKERLHELDALISSFGDNQSGWFKNLSAVFEKYKPFSEKHIKSLFADLKNGNFITDYNQFLGQFANIFQRQQMGLEILTSLSPKDDKPFSDESKTDVEKASEFAEDVARRASSLDTFAKSLQAEADKAAESNAADSKQKAEEARTARIKADDYRRKAEQIGAKAAAFAQATRNLEGAEGGLSAAQGTLDSLRQNADTTPEQIAAAEQQVAHAQSAQDTASQETSDAKNEFDTVKDTVAPSKKEMDDLKLKYPFIFQSNNIGILFDPTIQESILKKFKNDPNYKKYEEFFKRFFQQKNKNINWEELKTNVATECAIDSTLLQVISITNTTVRTMNRSMTDVLIRQIEINSGRTLTREEKDRLYKHIETQQIADETKFKNPLIETYVECLAEPNGKDCFIPTVHAIILQTATRGLMELFKNLTVSNFASLGALSKAFQHVSVVSSTFEALKDEKPPEVAAAPSPPKEQRVKVRIIDKDAQPTRSGNMHFSYIWMTPKQQRAAAAETSVRGSKGEFIIKPGKKPAAKTPAKAPDAAAAQGKPDAAAAQGKPDAAAAQVKPDAAAAQVKPDAAAQGKPDAAAAQVKQDAKQQKKEPEIVEIDGQKFQRTSTEDERFVFNPSENFRRFKDGVKDAFNPLKVLKRAKKESTKTDKQFEEEQVRKVMDKKKKEKTKDDEAEKPKDAEASDKSDKDEKIDIKFQKKEGNIQEESASVNSENDKKAEQIKGIDLTEYKKRFLKYYQSSKVYTYIHKPLVGAYQYMIDLKNWKPAGVRDFFTNWRTGPMLSLNVLGGIYKSMTWLNSKLSKFTSALGDLSTEFVKSMAKWVEDAAKLLISQITITADDGEEQAISGFGMILSGAKKLVNKLVDEGGKKVNDFAKYVGDFVKQKTRNLVFDIAEDKILGKKDAGGWLRWSFDWIKTGVLKIVGAVNFVSDKLDQIQNAISSSSADMWNKFVGINLTASVGKMLADVIDNIPENIDENNEQHREALGKSFEKAGKIITPFVDAVQGILKPGGISRFVYIMAKNKETYEKYIVFGQQNLSSVLHVIRTGIMHVLESFAMKLAVIVDLAVSVVKEIGTLMKSMISNGIDAIKGLFEQLSNVGSFLASGTGPGGSSFSLNGVRKIWSAITSITGDFLQSFKNLFDVFKIGFMRWVDISISDDWWGLGWVKNKVMNLAIPQHFDNQSQNKYNFLAAGGNRNRLKRLPATTSI